MFKKVQFKDLSLNDYFVLRDPTGSTYIPSSHVWICYNFCGKKCGLHHDRFEFIFPNDKTFVFTVPPLLVQGT